MGNLNFLIVISLVLGAAGLVAFFWTMRAGQYDDLDGAAERILIEEDEAEPDRSHRDADRSPPR